MILLLCLIVLFAAPATVDRLVAPAGPSVPLLRARRGAPTPAVPAAPAVAARLDEEAEDEPALSRAAAPTVAATSSVAPSAAAPAAEGPPRDRKSVV